MVASLETLKIETQVLPLNTLRVDFEKSPKTISSRREADLQARIVLPDGRRLGVCDRFWASFSSLNNLNRSVFSYFSHAEVFNRITARKGKKVRIAFESVGDGGRMLSLTNPTKPLLRVDEVRELISQSSGQNVTYHDGVAMATFSCPFPSSFKVVGDDFRTQFSLGMPIDGYGLPSAFLSLLRLVCTNGLVAMAPAFKSVFQLGKDALSLLGLLERAMDTFNNEEGFHALRLRIDASAKSWASLYEARRLRSCLQQSCTNDGFGPERRHELITRLDRACGDPLRMYGLSGHEEISTRRAKSIPVEATIYDLMNFATETTTHHFVGLPARNRINAWVGESLTKEYDLEDSVEAFPDYQDFFIPKSQAAAPADAGHPISVPTLAAA